MGKLEELTLEELEQKLAQVNKEQEKIERQRKVLQSEINTNIRKARNRLLIRVGAEWLNRNKFLIKDELYSERNFEKLTNRMDRLIDSVPRCPVCGSLLYRYTYSFKNTEWICCGYHCGAVYKDKKGVPDFS